MLVSLQNRRISFDIEWKSGDLFNGEKLTNSNILNHDVGMDFNYSSGSNMEISLKHFDMYPRTE